MFKLPRFASWTAAAVAATLLASPQAAPQESIPSVVVTVENLQPSRGVFLTPPWMGVHDGTFDTFEVGANATVPLGGDEIERLAEDGINEPLAATFDALEGSPQVEALSGPSGPLGPGDRVSTTINLDPMVHRYFSFASMVIPSNDTFIANDDMLAHPLFDETGRFVGRSFVVSGDDTLDAGTEINDELADNVAFLNQAQPDTGDDELGVVTTPSPGFAGRGTFSYPNGVLNHPTFAMADFSDADEPLMRVDFQRVDLGGIVVFTSGLGPEEEFGADLVDSRGRGRATLVASRAESVGIQVEFDGLTGPAQAAHLHLGQAGVNGPIVVDLGPGLSEGTIRFTADKDDLTGPLSGEPLLTLLNEMAAGNIYLNVHTEAFPAGEIRGQVAFRGPLKASTAVAGR